MTVRFALKRNGEMIAPPRVTYATHGVSNEVRAIEFLDAHHGGAPTLHAAAA